MPLCAAVAAAALVVVPGASAKGDGPRFVAAGSHSVWVGLGSGEVRQYDTKTLRLRQRFLRARAGAAASLHGLVSAAGAIWAAESTTLMCIDPRTRQARAVPGSTHAWRVVVGAGDLWTAGDPNRVTRVDAKRARIVARVRVPGRLSGLDGGPGGVVVQWARTTTLRGPWGVRFLRRLDPRTNRLTGPALRLDCDQTALVGRSAVWTIDQCSGALTRREPTTLRSTRSVALDARSYAAPVRSFGSLWIATGDRVVRVHPVTLAVLRTLQVRADGLAAGDDALWVIDTGDGLTGTLRRIDPRLNAVVGPSVRIAP